MIANAIVIVCDYSAIITNCVVHTGYIIGIIGSIGSISISCTIVMIIMAMMIGLVEEITIWPILNVWRNECYIEILLSEIDQL